jgi:hypothetical protein
MKEISEYTRAKDVEHPAPFPSHDDWDDAAESLARAYAKLKSVLDRTTLFVAQHGAPDLSRDYRLLTIAMGLDSACAQIALTSQALGYLCCGIEHGQFDRESMASSRALVQRAESLARRPGRNPELDYRVQLALEWIRMRPSGKNGDIVVKAREVQQARVANVQNSDEAKLLLRELERRGHGRVHRGRNRSLWFVLDRTRGDTRHRVGSQGSDGC